MARAATRTTRAPRQQSIIGGDCQAKFCIFRITAFAKLRAVEDMAKNRPYAVEQLGAKPNVSIRAADAGSPVGRTLDFSIYAQPPDGDHGAPGRRVVGSRMGRAKTPRELMTINC